MNIEESIEILESYKESLEEYEDNPRIIQAIEILLTSYEKEKEKNKELEDKIKAKIEEIDEVLKMRLIEKIRIHFEAQKEALQSLLEKE